MKKSLLILVIFLGISFGANSQIVIGESKGDGFVFNLDIVGDEPISMNNTVRVEIDFCEGIVKIIKPNKTKEYPIYLINPDNYGGVGEIICLNNEDNNIIVLSCSPNTIHIKDYKTNTTEMATILNKDVLDLIKVI